MNILVIGAGAIGGYVGGRLAARHQVTLLDRARLVEVVRARGLCIVEPDTQYAPRNIRAVDSLASAFEDTAHFDLALFCVKAYDTLNAIDPVRPYADRIDRFLSLQNGVTSEEHLGEAFGRDKIIAGSFLNPVSVPEPGVVRLEKRKGGLGLAPVGKVKIAPIVDAMRGIQLPVRVYDDYRSMKWSKLLLNLIGNATSAILDMNTLETFADRRVFAIEIAALREAIAVMDALSIKPVSLPGYPVPLLVFALRFMPIPILRIAMQPMAKSGRGGKLPSLLMDLTLGRPQSEIDALNGAVAQAGSAIGVKTPVNATLTNIVNDLVSGRVDRAVWRRQIDGVVDATKLPSRS
jgi:2-dehydropantoate 2-reductase